MDEFKIIGKAPQCKSSVSLLQKKGFRPPGGWAQGFREVGEEQWGVLTQIEPVKFSSGQV